MQHNNFNIEIKYGYSECPPFGDMVFKAEITNSTKNTKRNFEGPELSQVMDAVKDAILKQNEA